MFYVDCLASYYNFQRFENPGKLNATLSVPPVLHLIFSGLKELRVYTFISKSY